MYLAATQINAGGLWEAIRAFFTDFNKMFPGFEGSLEAARAPFFIFGFVILVYSLVKRLSGPGMSTSSNMRAITGVVALVGAMAFCIQITNLTQVAFLDLAQQMAPDADPVKIEESMEELLVTLTNGEVEKQKAAASGGQGVQGWYDKAKGVVAGAAAVASNPGAAINAGLDAALASITTLIEYAMVYIVVALCKLAQMVMWIVILVQKFLILINSIFLPVMIAMLSVSALSGVGTRYILSMFGVCAWPLAWGVVNAGTVAMLISVNNTLEGATDLNSLMSRIWAYAISMVIPFWLVFGYGFGPFILQKMVTTGVGVAQGLLGGAASMAGTAATSAAGLVMLGGGAPALASASAGSSGAAGHSQSNSSSSGGGGGGSSSGAGGTGTGPSSSGSGSGSSGASLAGTFATAAGASMQVAGAAVGSAGNALAATEGHSGVYSSNAGNANSSDSATTNTSASQPGGGKGAGANNAVNGGTSGEGASLAGNASSAKQGVGSSSKSKSASPRKPAMSLAELDAYAEQRAIEMATPQQPTSASDLYPGLSESSADAWHQEQIRSGLT